MITVPPPVFPASLALELLANRVIPIPFDESTVVEGTVFPTTVSSPDDVVRGILAVGLEKAKTNQGKQIAKLEKKYSIAIN